MNLNFLRKIFFLVGIALITAVASAQLQAADEPVSVVLVLRVVSLDAQSGQETLTESESVRPGDTVEYEAVYTNNLPNAIGDVMATLPLPVSMEYQPGSALPEGVTASLDGVTFEAVPLRRTVVRAGREVTEEVPYAEYRALRWRIATLQSGQSTSVKARARVTSDNS